MLYMETIKAFMSVGHGSFEDIFFTSLKSIYKLINIVSYHIVIIADIAMKIKFVANRIVKQC